MTAKKSETGEIYPLLQCLSVFEGLDSVELKEIENLCSKVGYAKGEKIFDDLSPGNDLYIILNGEVVIQLESITPNYEISITKIGAGQILGELALIDSEPRSASAICSLTTQALRLNGSALTALFEKEHHIGYVVMRNIATIICERIRRTNRRLLNALRCRLF
ncbi:MAG: cyclic nucleotide-binding domain-containing protein [bacterium]